ncbi:MAG: AAA family ATPase [Limnothrix sp. RL_2_0]|nr:AAA family ATPase [Limnothrix sp. RL_2_0]
MAPRSREQLIDTFYKALNNLELFPLETQENLDKFVIGYDDTTLNELEDLVTYTSSKDEKIIFSGHTGCGKSTLLAALERRFTSSRLVVRFSIANMIENADINHINILFSIAIKLMEEAEKQNVPLSQQTKQEILNWFAKRTKIEQAELKTEANVGANILSIIGLRLKVDAAIREEIKQEFQHKVTDLVSKLNDIISIIGTAVGKPILVIIDDIDKLDLRVISEIFVSNIKALFLPNCQIIYTLPISALHDKDILPVLETETSDRIVQMRVLKLFVKGESHKPDPQPVPKTRKLLLELLGKRINLELFETDAVDDLIIYSGGVLREVIRIVQQCCRLALGRIRRAPEDEDFSDYKISTAIVGEAINKLRLQISRPLGKIDLEILDQVYRNYAPDDPRDDEFLGLLKGLQVVEYRNSKEWHDVHPILWELMAERQQA